MKSRTNRSQNLTSFYRTSKPFGALDGIIIAILLVAIVLCCIFTYPKSQGSTAIIYHNGKEIGKYSLTADTNITLVDGNMLLTIENGYCFVRESNCKNQICVHTGKISKNGERIVCTPNKITIIIKSDEKVIITGGAQWFHVLKN